MTPRPLTQLLQTIDPAALLAGQDYCVTGEPIAITGLTADSRQVAPGMLFAALSGTAHDGRSFIAEAMAQGAAVILAGRETQVPESVTAIHADNPRRLLAHLAAAFYEIAPPHIAAVTGTNGKTSTAQFVREIMTALGQKAASIGTLGVIGPGLDNYGTLTTPDAITLHRILAELAQAGITHVCLEASSHGLAQARLEAVKIQAAGFTNLTRDHLDFHGSMENYFAAKARLFNEILQADGAAVLNADAEVSAELCRHARKRGCRVLTYGEEGRELRLLGIRPHSQGQTLALDFFGKKQEIELNIVGRFQVWNALGAVGLAVGLGAEPQQALAALPLLTGVKGRLQLAGTHRNGATVFVDYAHTPDALETVLRALRPHVGANGRLLVVFGCGGNRDRGKRPLMGALAQELADIAIVTDDNPRHEDAAAIRAEIISGCQPTPKMHEIADREAAIRAAAGQLRQGDVLVIAGKGHEPGQIVGDHVFPFDDAAIVRASLEAAS